MAEPIKLHRTPPQEDIVGGLRNLADQIEQGKVDGMPVISTVAVCLGHTKLTLIEGGEIEHESVFELFAWGPRKDIFTVRGLLTTICNRL